MFRKLWQNVYKSVCLIDLLKNNESISTGSGFKVENKLVTNYHVIEDATKDITHIRLRFVNEDSDTESCSKIITSKEFMTKLTDSMPPNSWDYAIFDLDWPEFRFVPALNLCAKDDFRIGQPIAVFGYQFGYQNLSVHNGIISSRFAENKIKYIQLDASVNNGNSGGPLINPETSEVIGIVTKKVTGLSEQFDELSKSLNNNIKVLNDVSKSGAVIRLSGIDPIESITVSQTQIAKLSQEIYRSANVGIGYAYELEKIRLGINK